jgi:hypothetical protein
MSGFVAPNGASLDNLSLDQECTLEEVVAMMQSYVELAQMYINLITKE